MRYVIRMGRQSRGSSVAGKLVAFRLNEQELADLERKRQARGLSTSAYYRKLQQEDKGL